MASAADIIFYTLAFFSVYVQVFFFITFLENRKNIITRKGKIILRDYPAVTIAVPCFNEEGTVEKSIHSLLRLNYPQDRLQIFLINDGSTDNTPRILEKFAILPNVKIFHKENGGKYTALNLALQNLETEFFGGLDADSFADPEALVRIMSYFEKSPLTMAVAPSIAVSYPKNIVQYAQKAEYHMGIYFKKMLCLFGAINVTPGPLTVFRRKVFDDLGPYRHGHSTEDMEIAYRMQKYQYKIEHCNDAYVYTNTPPTVRKLYRQRTRWIYGFINNTIDYRHLLFRKQYGNFAMFTLPMGVISIFSVGYLFGRIVYRVVEFLATKILTVRTIGWNAYFGSAATNIDSFFISSKALFFLIAIVYLFIFFSIIFGKKLTEDKWRFSLDILYFFPVFTLVAPLWLAKAIFNTILQRKPAWR